MIKIKLKFSSKLNEQEEAQKQRVILKDLYQKIEMFKDTIWVVYDIESTGFDPKIHQVTQIAAKVVEYKITNNNNSNEVNLIEDELNTFKSHCMLNQEILDIIDDPLKKTQDNEKSIKDVLKMTGYDLENHKKYKIEEQQLVESFINYLNKLSNKNRKVILVGQNIINFDNKFIKARAIKHGLTPFDSDVLDTKDIMHNIYYPLLKAKKSNNFLNKIKNPDGSHTFSLGIIAKALDVSNENWHDALEDVKMLISVMGKILQEINNNLDLDVTDAQDEIRKEKIARANAKKALKTTNIVKTEI